MRSAASGLAVFLIFGLVACGGGGEPGCQFGENQGCTCSGGASGTQTCQADGNWSACVCESYCGDQVCDPGEDEVSCPADCSGNQECAIQTGHAGCDGCINLSCMSSCSACAESADCLGLWNCQNACQDGACVQACQDQFPGGQSLLDAFAGPSGCIGTSCQTSCSASCGNGVCDPGEDATSCPADCQSTDECDQLTGMAQCDQCLAEFCAQQCQACYANSDCWDLKNCQAGCGSDIPCIQQCAQDYAAGMQDFNDLMGPSGCLVTSCASACQ